MSHISFDEMVKFAFSTEFNSDMMQLGIKCNAHFMECSECFGEYNRLIEIKELMESITAIKENEIEENGAVPEIFQSVGVKTLIDAAEDAGERAVNRVREWIYGIKKATSEIMLSVTSDMRLNVSNSMLRGDRDGFDFGVPLIVGARGVSGSANTSGDLEGRMLIDDENSENTISLDINHIITIRLNHDCFDEDEPCVFLISDGGNAYCSSMKSDNGIYTAEFKNVLSGEYRIIAG